MAYDFDPQPGEEIVENAWYQAASHGEPFACVVTTAAVHVSRSTFIKGRHLHRIPLEDVAEVRVERVRPYFAWFFGLALFIAGATTSVLMFVEPVVEEGTNLVKFWVAPFGLTAVGLVLPFAARGRYALRIQTHNKSHRWKPPFVLGSKARSDVRKTIMSVVNAARHVGIAVSLPPSFG